MNKTTPKYLAHRSMKRVIAHQIEREMLKENITKAELAEKMETSRSAVNRLLDPENHSVTLQTLEKVSEILDKKLEIYFKD